MIMKKNDIICFYHEYEEYGCFSNWYSASFEYAGKVYNSVEQYMMYQKVILFREFELADKIMASDDPSEIKEIGRSKMRHFDSELWDKISYTIVKRGIRAKFLQNKDICKVLIDTGNKLLAEASSKDLKWGIGISINDNSCYDTKFWHGKNLLGEILMEVRDELLILSIKDNAKYIDAKDVAFNEWNMMAGILECIPKFHDTIHAYADTLIGTREKNCFYNDVNLALLEVSMRTDMGGGLPAIGFWEMKQDIFDITRIYT